MRSSLKYIQYILLTSLFWVNNVKAQKIKATSFPLKDVHLLTSSFYNAKKLDSGYILSLSPNRLLHRFHKNAGLIVKDSVYGGWESDGLSGHTLGHYLSASSMMYSTTRNKSFKTNVDYIVSELAICQNARRTGYVGAIPNEDTLWAKIRRSEIKSSGFDLNGAWSPWYTVHKVMAGLMDAYFYVDNQQALEVAIKLADWTYDLVAPLSDSVRLKMLNCEYGGMNEVLANIYAVTNNVKYLKASQLFQDDFVMGKLANQIDPMPGKHSNTNVPKAIAAARQFELTGSVKDSTIASYFWQTMVQNHSYVIGGNSNYEYCGDPKRLNDRLSDATCETCNTYNMLKLTSHLFTWEPSSKLGDYYERALYNHILASQHSKTGMMTYFLPLRMGTAKQFSDSTNTFTCCVGSGMENHSKYEESIYFQGIDGSLYVNLFIPSVLNWTAKKSTIIQTTNFPNSNSSKITYQGKKAQKFAIKIRKPSWSATIKLLVNNVNYAYTQDNNGFLIVNRQWKNNDELSIVFDMHLYAESMPDNENRIAFLYGPVVLAGNLGDKMPDPVFGTPVIMDANPLAKINKVSQDALLFKWNAIGKPKDVQMMPLYAINDDYYSVYWDKFTAAEWTLKEKEYEAEKVRVQQIEARTIDQFRIGEMQPERDHQLIATEKSYVTDAVGRMGREARLNNNFQFYMKQLANENCSLLLTYIGDDKDRKFDILINDQFLTTVDWKGGATGRFYDIEYPLPRIESNKNIKVTILANHGKTAGRIFGARILKNTFKVTSTHFGFIKDKPVQLYTITNSKGNFIKVTNYGGILTNWTVPDQNGHLASVLVGLDSLSDYLKDPPYFGALIGRYGNRIAKGKFTINNTNYQLATNNGENHLHGGLQGFDKVIWTPTILNDSSIQLHYLSKDGEEGYPGNLNVDVIYRYSNADELIIEYKATTDKPTPVNLTNHAYYNLSGDFNRTILNHYLQINADGYTPVDYGLIPTGVIEKVKNSAFDFTKPYLIGERIGTVKGGYDHNWVLTKKNNELSVVAELYDKISGRKMQVSTTEIGLQFYSGNFLDGKFKEQYGAQLFKHNALCLETQHFPNSPNQLNFPTTILKPGQEYNSKTIYKMSVQ